MKDRRILLATCAIVGASCSTASRAGDDWRYKPPTRGMSASIVWPEVETFRLPNGLRVIVVRRPSLATFVVRVTIRGGSRTDPPHQAGLSAVAASLLAEELQAADEKGVGTRLATLGVRAAVDADRDALFFTLQGLLPSLGDAVTLLAELLLLPSASFERMQGAHHRAKGAVEASHVLPRSRVLDAFLQSAYGPGHPFSLPLYGTKESIKSIDRDDMWRFFQERLRPDMSVAVIVGDLRAASARKYMAPLAKWQPPRAASYSTPMELSPPALRSSRVVVIDARDAAQATLAIGTTLPIEGPREWHKLLMLNEILGAVHASRISQNLRVQHGYAYYFRSRLQRRSTDAGVWYATGGVTPDKVYEAAKEVLREILRMREAPPTNEEVEYARRSRALFYARRLQGSFDIAGLFDAVTVYDEPLDFLEREVGGIQYVDANDVWETAQKYFSTKDLVIIAHGPATQLMPSLRQLGGPIEFLPE